jgi:hypothetical protein
MLFARGAYNFRIPDSFEMAEANIVAPGVNSDWRIGGGKRSTVEGMNILYRIIFNLPKIIEITDKKE